MSIFCIGKSIEIPAIITVFVHNWYSEALVKELQSKNCTFTQKAGFPMHFHCRLTANICSAGGWLKRVKSATNLLYIVYEFSHSVFNMVPM